MWVGKRKKIRAFYNSNAIISATVYMYGAGNVQKYALNDTLLFYSHNAEAITSRRLFAENKLGYNMRLRLLKTKTKIKNVSSRRRNENKISFVAALSAESYRFESERGIYINENGVREQRVPIFLDS